MEYLKLLGLVVVIAGMALRLNAALVVTVAGILTGLIAGFPIVGDAARPGILDLLGKSFVDARLMLLFLLILPAVGLMEDEGMKERARDLVAGLRSATAGRLLFLYQLIREIGGGLGIRLGGHESMVRPLLYPMALGMAKRDSPSPVDEDRIKAACSAADNYGNFFGQNLFPAAPGILLIQQVTLNLGYRTDLVSLALWSVPIAGMALILGLAQFARLDRRLKAGDRSRT